MKNIIMLMNKIVSFCNYVDSGSSEYINLLVPKKCLLYVSNKKIIIHTQMMETIVDITSTNDLDKTNVEYIDHRNTFGSITHYNLNVVDDVQYFSGSGFSDKTPDIMSCIEAHTLTRDKALNIDGDAYFNIVLYKPYLYHIYEMFKTNHTLYSDEMVSFSIQHDDDIELILTQAIVELEEKYAEFI